MAALDRIAPAKLNLFLHVGPAGQDGYHPLASLVTFADVGDVVSLEESDAFELLVRGPFAEGLSAGPDNLVARACEAMARALGIAPAFRITLDKRLPIAAGLGGGSSDAAATLLLMAQALGLPPDDPARDAMRNIARDLGADVTACLEAAPSLALGRGDRLDRPPAFPYLDAVLVNPGAPSPTGAVYRAYDDMGAPGADDVPPFPASMGSARETADFLRRCRNDLEAPAIALQPAIGEALERLRRQPQTLLARMSGSGATSFALCASGADARDLARRVASEDPRWWVRACRLTGFHA